MKRIIELSAAERKELLKVYRSGTDVRAACRAHVLVLLSSGWTWRRTREALFCSNDLIGHVTGLFQAGGVAAVLNGSQTGSSSGSSTFPEWWNLVIDWLTRKTPQDFGYLHSRWSCKRLSGALAWKAKVRTSLAVCAAGRPSER